MLVMTDTPAAAGKEASAGQTPAGQAAAKIGEAADLTASLRLAVRELVSVPSAAMHDVSDHDKARLKDTATDLRDLGVIFERAYVMYLSAGLPAEKASL
jgi:hypothetical protein